MNFQHVSLRNFKCFAEADLDLDTGVTVIHGVNGSGKSTLLEACFFALYGSKALDDRTLADVITNGEEECEVELRFRHDGADYRIERRVRYSGDRPQTATCVLEGPEHTVEGARAVRREVADLLRMDADAFVNCAYVRQGEVNKLIHATPTERQDMIDDLLQLGRLEEYRERAAEARLAVEDVLENVRGQADQLERQIEAKEEKGLHATLNDLESDRKEVVADVERYEDQRAEAERTRDQAEEILEAHEEKREELEAVREDIAELRDAIAETESEREQLGDRLRERRQQRTDLAERRDDLLAESDLDAADSDAVEQAIADHREEDDRLQERIEELKVAIQEHASEAERLRERADELADEAAEQRERADELESQVEDDEAALADRREKLDDLDADIEAAEAAFEDAPVAFGEAADHLADLEDERADLVERRESVRAERESARERVAEAEELKAEGKCPECGQDVADAPHVDALSEYRERVETLDEDLADLDDDLDALDERIEGAAALVEAEREAETLRENRNNVEALLADKRETLADRRERLAECRERAAELDAEATEKREAAETAAETADEKRAELGEVNGDRQTVRERIERLETLADVLDDLDAAAEDVESLESERESLEERNDERREWLTEKRDRRDELEDAYDAERVEEAREERERATNYIEQVDERLDDLRERRDDLTDRIGGVRNELDELESLRERREAVVARRERLESLHGETEQLQAMYGDLRAELRQRNVETLERMLNETFDLVYQNDSYSHIDLDAEYQLTVYQKDGEPLSPEQLSGGERALFNLSLRCAIYELLSEGIEGSAPMPPLILDEPTVFLDSGHVSQLVTLVESMREVGVEQILVVSHDEELVGAADELVQVRKDATSNRSSVERGEQLLLP